MILRVSIPRVRKHFGFTLVEVLIAVLLVGVLSAIAIPKYSDYRARIDQSKAIADIKILEVLIADFFASGGTYPASLADIGNADLRDPWGNPYVYVDLTSIKGKGKARKDHKFNPINSDYDLYSSGKNRVSKTQLTQKDSVDDIVRGRDGQFVGLARDFSP